MKIGTLARKLDGQSSILVGALDTLDLSLSIRLEPTGDGADSKRPSHRILAVRRDGTLVEVGAAWTKAATRADGPPTEFLSLTIDDVSMEKPLNVAAFTDDNGASYAITFRRRQNAHS